MTSSSASSEVNGGLIKFKNRRCYCGRKASVKISESTKNPSKLYFTCDQGKRKYYTFWSPDDEEYNMHEDAISEQRVSEQRQRRGIHGAEMNMSCENRERSIKVQNVEGLQAGLKIMVVLNIVFLCITSVVLILAIMNMK